MSIQSLCLVVVVLAVCQLVSALPPGAVKNINLDRAKELLSKNMLIDGHNDWPYMLRKNFDNKLEKVDLNNIDNIKYALNATNHVTHTDITRLREGKVGGQFWAVCDIIKF